MKKKDLLQRLAEEKRAAMEGGSLCDSTYLTYTHPDGTVEHRHKVYFFLNIILIYLGTNCICSLITANNYMRSYVFLLG